MPVSIGVFFFKPELFRFVFCLLFDGRMSFSQLCDQLGCLIRYVGILLIHWRSLRVIVSQYIDLDVAPFEDEVGILSPRIDAAKTGDVRFSGEFKLPVGHLRAIHFHSVVITADIECLSVQGRIVYQTFYRIGVPIVLCVGYPGYGSKRQSEENVFH